MWTCVVRSEESTFKLLQTTRYCWHSFLIKVTHWLCVALQILNEMLLYTLQQFNHYSRVFHDTIQVLQCCYNTKLGMKKKPWSTINIPYIYQNCRPTRTCITNSESNSSFLHFNVLASICCNTVLSSLPTPCWSALLCPLTSSLGPPGCSRCQWRCCDGSWRAQTFSWLGFSQELSMTDSGQGEGSQTHYWNSICLSQPQHKLYIVHDTGGHWSERYLYDLMAW